MSRSIKWCVLVPAVAVFGGRALGHDAPVTLGRTAAHVAVRVGPWAVVLAIDTAGRFPPVSASIPAVPATATTCRLAPEDAAFLARAVPRLPGQDGDHAPVTVDLNGHVVVRAKADDQDRMTEVVLGRSVVTGPPVRFVTNRQYLARAARLGFEALHVIKPDVPVVCRDERRTYIWVPLGTDGALPPAADAVRISSTGAEPPPVQPTNERSRVAMSKVEKNGPSAEKNGGRNGAAAPTREQPPRDDTPPGSAGLGGLLEEAQALKLALRDAYRRSSRLVAAVRRQKKQSKLVASTLASLRQLQKIES